MKNTLAKIRIDNVTYLLLFLALISGYIKRAFLIIIIVLVHEIGHVFFFLLFKIDIESVVIYPFGGVTKVNKRIHERIYKDVLISLGGVAFQVILCFVFLLLYHNGLVVKSTIDIFIQYDTSIMLFNLLPLVPLDGSKLLLSLCSKFFSYKICLKFQQFIGVVSLVIFIIFVLGRGLNDVIILAFLLIKLIELFKNNKYFLNRFYLERVLYNNYYDGIINDGDVDKMRIDKYYFFKENGRYVREEKYLLKNRF